MSHHSNIYHKCHIDSSATVCRFLFLVALGATVLSACAGEQYGMSATYKARVYKTSIYKTSIYMLAESRKCSASNLSQIPLKMERHLLLISAHSKQLDIIVLKMYEVHSKSSRTGWIS